MKKEIADRSVEASTFFLLLKKLINYKVAIYIPGNLTAREGVLRAVNSDYIELERVGGSLITYIPTNRIEQVNAEKQGVVDK